MSEFENGAATPRQDQGAAQQASAVAQKAGQAAGELGGTAAVQAKAVAGEIGDQARDLFAQMRGRLAQETQTQARRASSTLRQWGDDLDSAARNTPADSPARSLVAQAAGRGHRAAEYLDKRGVDGLVEDLQGFARRRPAAFLGGALLAGMMAGRLAKAAGSGGDGGTQPPAAPAQLPATSAPLYPAAATGEAPLEPTRTVTAGVADETGPAQPRAPYYPEA